RCHFLAEPALVRAHGAGVAVLSLISTFRFHPKPINTTMKAQFKTTAAVLSLFAATALAAQAQTVTNPCPNRVIGWNFDNNGTINPTDLAGLAPATNWANSWPINPTLGLPDNTGAAS